MSHSKHVLGFPFASHFALWTIETTGGMALGAVEKRPDGFFIVPVASSPLGDLDPLPYISLERALEGVGAHLQGNCALDEARPGRAPPTL